MKIAVFLHGTTIMHSSGQGHTREERVLQVKQRDPSVRDFEAYVPIGQAADKVRAWSQQGAEIIYFSSHKRLEHVEQDRAVLTTYRFPPGPLIFREAGETYQDMTRRVMSDIVIEDDCESIGGAREMIYPHLKAEDQARMMSIVVKEFEGIDHLADDPAALI